MGQAQPESGWSLRWTNRLLSPRRVGAGWGGFQDGQVVLSCPPRDLRSPPSPGQDARRDKKSLGGLGTIAWAMQKCHTGRCHVMGEDQPSAIFMLHLQLPKP